MILAYHSIHPRRRGPLTVSPEVFQWQMELLHRRGYEAVSLDTLLRARREGRPVKSKWVALTFDDGYQDNYQYAFPVLRRLGFPAAIFVVTGMIGKEEVLEPDLSMDVYGGAQEDYRMLDLDQIREMAGDGITIGSHSVTHRRLTTMPMEQVEWELTSSKEELEKGLGKPVEFFCYPGGQHNPAIANLTQKAGYSAAVVTPSGPGISDGHFTLKRVGIYGHDSPWSFQLKLSPAFSRLRESSLLWSALRAVRRR